MRIVASALALAAGLVATADAHHGITGQFDTSTTFDISGVVTELRFVNPHSYVYFDVTTESGEVVPWRCEMRAGTVLRRSGWSEEMFSPGTRIEIVGSPDRVDSQTCYVVTVTFEDGMMVERYGQLDSDDAPGNAAAQRPARLANGQPNISGDWARPQRLQLGDATRGLSPGMGIGMGMGSGLERTTLGTAAVEGYVREDNPRFQCMAVNIFADWVFDQHVNRVIQEDDTITLMYGFMDIVRVIHLDMDEHPGDIQLSRSGHSIGRWADDVLSVDTVGFEPGYLETRNAVMHSDQMHVVEEFSYDHENGMLSRSWVAEDPLYFVGQYTGQDTIEFADIRYEPYDCADLTNDHIADTP